MTAAARLTDVIFRKRHLFLGFFLGLVAFLAAGVPRLEMSSNSRGFFGPHNAEYLDLLHLDETYTQSNTLLLMGVPPKGDAFSPENLTVLRQMTEDLWQMPYVLRVESPSNHMHSYAQGDEVLVEPMLDEFAEITQSSAGRFTELALASDRLRNTLLAEDGEAFGIVIHFVLPDDEPDAQDEVSQFLTDLRASWAAQYPDWTVHATGGILGNSLLARVAIEDVTYLVPLALLAVIVLFALTLGSLLAVGALVLVLASATLATFGFAGWTNVVLTAGTAISPMAVLVLVSTSCIHIVISTIRATEKGQVDDPLRYAIENNLAPVSVSHLTTALGFLCLNFAPSPPLADMGNIVAFGLLIGHLAVFTLLPVILIHKPPSKVGLLMVAGDSMRTFAVWVLRHSRLWLVVFAVSGMLAAIGVARIGYDDHVIRYFDLRYEFRQDAEAIQTDLTGLDSLQFSFQAPEGASVFDPEFLRSVDRFAVWLESQPSVVAVNALTEVIKDLNQSMSGDDPAAYTIADTQPANAQLLMFYELSLPLGMDLTTIMDVERTQTLLNVTLCAPHSDVTRNLAETAERWLAENEPQIATRAAGLAIAFARISERNNSQMLFGFLTALCLISVTLIVTLRSVRYGLISLAPNLAPALLAFGFWGLTLGDVNLGSTVVTTMTFGIVVDDTIHFLMHHLRNRRRGLGTQEALEDTFAVVGSSITLTSVAMILGFSIMAASGFSINQHIGMLTAVVIVFALLCDLVLLPSIIKLTQEDK
ncbi:MAG: efflux RND transporter permease subunit [Marivita sp.]|uniref:efflux RND transporter permease subunit n=1 Tax=Marivita sp. TaxID=2003365 RepID=UPI003EF5BFBD